MLGGAPRQGLDGDGGEGGPEWEERERELSRHFVWVSEQLRRLGKPVGISEKQHFPRERKQAIRTSPRATRAQDAAGIRDESELGESSSCTSCELGRLAAASAMLRTMMGFSSSRRLVVGFHATGGSAPERTIIAWGIPSIL